MVAIHPRWTYDPFAPFDTCPACLGPLQPHCEGEQVTFRCDACSIAWRLSLGHLLWSRLESSDAGHVPAQRAFAEKLPANHGEAAAGQGR
jgi:hypothetical protein